jgi:hypothetical protein
MMGLPQGYILVYWEIQGGKYQMRSFRGKCQKKEKIRKKKMGSKRGKFMQNREELWQNGHDRN